LAAGAAPAHAQQIANVIDAPFTATFERTTPGQPKRTCQIARASNGSVYFGCAGSNGKITSVDINDVPNNRQIAFFPPAPGNFNHTYRLYPPQEGKFKILSAQEVREQLRSGKGFCCCEEEPENALGQKLSDGLTLFGFRTVKTYADGSKRVTEYWESDLGVVVSSKALGPQPGEEHSYVVRDVLREEPDPRLFEIPKEYISDPLREAKTLYVENLTGFPEVMEAALGELDFWRKDSRVRYVEPYTVVNEKNAADLTATFTVVPVVAGSDKPGIQLEVFSRDSSDPAYHVALAWVRDSVNGHKLIAMQCFNALWNRLASTRVGLQQLAGHSN